MNSLDNWVHLNPHIQLQGRCSTYIDPSLSEEQKEALTAELAEKDPPVERLKGVSEDKPFEAMGFTANWTCAIAGESVPVSQVGKLEGQNLIYGVAVLRNTVWPGAMTVGYRGGWVNFYAGYGHRISQTYDAIKEVGEVQLEAEEAEERPEPNPAVAPAAQGYNAY